MQRHMLFLVDNLALAYNTRCDSDVAKITCIYKACYSSKLSQPWKNVPLVMGFGSYVKDALVVCMESSCTSQARTRKNEASCPWFNNLETVWHTFWRTSTEMDSVSARVHTTLYTLITGKESRCIAEAPLRILGTLMSPALAV